MISSSKDIRVGNSGKFSAKSFSELVTRENVTIKKISSYWLGKMYIIKMIRVNRESSFEKFDFVSSLRVKKRQLII